jgi:hypothetical protein
MGYSNEREAEIRKRGMEISRCMKNMREFKSLLHEKPDWEKFQEVFQKNGITCLYHFTDRDNLESIKRNGGLFSWSFLNRHGLYPARPGGSLLSRVLDKRYEIEDYVSLSYVLDHPMMMMAKMDNRITWLAILKIDLCVAYFEKTLFCDMNATNMMHRIGSNIEDLNKVHLDVVKQGYKTREKHDPERLFYQAEVLVKTWIPIEYIDIDHPLPIELSLDV